MSVAGKVVAVTGVTTGLGRVLALVFAQRGALVVGCGRTLDSGSALEEEARLDEKIKVNSGSVQFIAADLSDPEQCVAFIRQVVETHGRMDVLINNAGGHVEGGVGPSTAIETEAWDRTMDLNLRSVFVCCREAIETMRDQESGGLILNVASVQAEVALAQMAPYNAAKAAVVQLSRTLAVEFVDQNVRVNAIILGSVDTGALTTLRRWLSDGVAAADERNGLTNKPPTAVQQPAVQQGSGALRSQRPEDVARAFVALAGDDAALITGASIAIDRTLSVGLPLSSSVLERARISTAE